MRSGAAHRGLAVLALLAAAEARSADRVELQVATSCGEEFTLALRRILVVELGLPVEQGPGPGGDQLSVDCAANGAQVSAHAAQGAGLSRQVDLSGQVAAAKPRLVALALSELLRASRLPRLEPKAPPSLPPRTKPSVRWGAAAAATYFFRDRVPAWGGALELDGPAFAGLVWATDLLLQEARSEYALGRVDRWLGSASARLQLDRSSGLLAWGAGLGARVGWGRLVGVPTQPVLVAGSAVSGVWAGPMGVAELTVPKAALGAWLEVGIVARTLTGTIGQPTSVGLAGVWGTLNVGVRFPRP